MNPDDKRTSPADKTAVRDPVRAAWWVAMAAASAALVASIWSVPYLPTNDGPYAVLASHIQNHYGDPGSRFSEFVTPNLQFTHVGFSTLFTPLESLLPWEDALRLTLSMTALGMAWGVAALVLALDPRRRFVALLGFVFAITWNTYMGFFAYEVATTIGLAVLALAVSQHRLSLRQRGYLAAGLLVQAAAHVFAAGLTGMALAAMLVARASGKDRLKELARVTLMGVPAMVIAAATSAQRSQFAKIPLASEWEWVPWGDRLRQLPNLILPGDPVRAWIAFTIVVGALVAAGVRWRRLKPVERGALFASSTFLIAALLSPLNAPGWQMLSPRFLPAAVALAVALIPLELLSSARHRAAAAGLLIGTTALSLVGSAALHHRLYEGCRDALSGLERPIRRTGFTLPIVLDPYCGVARTPSASAVPYLAPNRHLGALYSVAHGGMVPYFFAGGSAAYAFKLRRHAALPVSVPPIERFWPVVETEAFRHDAPFRSRVVQELGLFGAGYEAVLVFGAEPHDIDELTGMGYTAQWSQGALFIGRFAGCDAEVRVTGPLASRVLRFAWGTPSTAAAVWTGVLPQAPRSEARFPLLGLPCGAVWMRVSEHGAPTSDGGPSAACQGADAQGRLTVQLLPGAANVVVCEAK